ncbi:YceI family protein [Massilia sp. PWRC2]|uniref:YceI family protein n=1 Tax=Massilia sp. PWRC2 TaxID=2804626 RepID=UPI003CF08BEC
MPAQRTCLALGLALALAACAPPAAPPPALSLPAASARTAPGDRLPAATVAWYRQAHAGGAAVLAIGGGNAGSNPAVSSAGSSRIVVTVRRGGPLARLGHDHVVASEQIGGLIAPSLGRADFGFRLDQLTVDDPLLRAQAQLDTQPSAEAIAGTRLNMLNRVLEAELYPEVLMRVTVAPLASGSASASASAQLSITLHGVTRTLATPVLIEQTAAGLRASGTLTLRQSDFGITPMSVMNGAMTVLDTLELRYRIEATAAAQF